MTLQAFVTRFKKKITFAHLLDDKLNTKLNFLLTVKYEISYSPEFLSSTLILNFASVDINTRQKNCETATLKRTVCSEPFLRMYGCIWAWIRTGEGGVVY
jgi:hypothetical protein